MTCTEANILINSATGHETITLSNIIATSIADVHIHVTLKGPDGAVMSSSLIAIIPNTAISSSTISVSDASLLCRGWNFHETFASDISNGGTFDFPSSALPISQWDDKYNDLGISIEDDEWTAGTTSGSGDFYHVHVGKIATSGAKLGYRGSPGTTSHSGNKTVRTSPSGKYYLYNTQTWRLLSSSYAHGLADTSSTVMGQTSTSAWTDIQSHFNWYVITLLVEFTSDGLVPTPYGYTQTDTQSIYNSLEFPIIPCFTLNSSGQVMRGNSYHDYDNIPTCKINIIGSNNNAEGVLYLKNHVSGSSEQLALPIERHLPMYFNNGPVALTFAINWSSANAYTNVTHTQQDDTCKIYINGYNYDWLKFYHFNQGSNKMWHTRTHATFGESSTTFKGINYEKHVFTAPSANATTRSNWGSQWRGQRLQFTTVNHSSGGGTLQVGKYHNFFEMKDCILQNLTSDDIDKQVGDMFEYWGITENTRLYDISIN